MGRTSVDHTGIQNSALSKQDALEVEKLPNPANHEAHLLVTRSQATLFCLFATIVCS